MDWKNLFLSPGGRIGQKEFWIGWVILFVIGIILNILPEGLKPIAGIVSLAMIYPSVCVYSKRLHDAGRSGWLAALPYAVWFLAGILGVLVGGAGMLAMLSGDTSAMTGGIAGLGMALLIILAALVFYIAFTVWVGIGKSDPAPNQYGPPPSSAPATV